MFNQVKESLPSSNLLLSAAIIVVMVLSLMFVEHKRKANAEHPDTIKGIPLTYTALKYTIVLLSVFAILETNGVNVSSFITGLGIASVIIAFALEEFLRDIIMGSAIKSYRFYNEGDVIEFQGEAGVVKEINLRFTTIETISCRNKMIISNRNIDKIKVLSNQININVPFSFNTPRDKAIPILIDCCEEIKKCCSDITDAVFKGTQEIEEYAIIYRIKIFCDPSNRNQLRRDAISVIQRVVNENGINFPYKAFELYNHNMEE